MEACKTQLDDGIYFFKRFFECVANLLDSITRTNLEPMPSVWYGNAILSPCSDRIGAKDSIAVAFGRHQAHTIGRMKRPERPRRSMGHVTWR